MVEYAPPLNRLIEELKRIPGDRRPRRAQRIAFHHPGQPAGRRRARWPRPSGTSRRASSTCSVCNNITHVDPCALLLRRGPRDDSPVHRRGALQHRDDREDRRLPRPVPRPARGPGPAQGRRPGRSQGWTARRAAAPRRRFAEIIIATNPTADGEATAHFLARVLRDMAVRLTRLAMGLPVGSDIDFADQVTIRKPWKAGRRSKTSHRYLKS